jgi:flagellin
MASVINTNMASLYAQKNLSGAQNALSTSVERLSSGLRINRAKDDAAGLGISEKIKSQVTSLNQGLRNANDAISMVQTAEGSLSEVSSILQRMKELSVQARNDSLSTTQRSFISDELVALKNEINSIAERTTFNDLSLLKNALRTQVSVPALADATKITNGASLLSGVSVSGLSVNNTNVGTYTLTTGTQAPIANQISEAAGKFGGNEVDTLTIAGTVDDWDEGDTITATIAIEGGETLEVTYTVTAGDEDVSDVAVGTAAGATQLLSNIAAGLAAAINVKAQEAGGVPLAARANGAVVYLGGATDGVTMTTTVSIDAQNDDSTAAVNVSTSQIDQASRRVTINMDDGVEGNKFVLTVGSKEYSVVAGSGTDSEAIAATVAADLLALVQADYPSGTGTDATVTSVAAANWTYFDFKTGAGLGVADISLRVARLSPGDVVENTLSEVSSGSTTTTSLARTITLNDFDIVEGRQLTVRVGNPDFTSEYSLVIDANDDANAVAIKLESLLDDNFTTSGTPTGNQVTLTAANYLGMSTIEGAAVAPSSTVSAQNHARNDRTITINRGDLSPGNVVSVEVAGKEYAYKVQSGDDENDVAYAISQLLSADYPGGVIAPTIDGADTSQINFAENGMRKGDSITISGLTFYAGRDVTKEEVAAAFAEIGGDYTATGSTSPANRYGYFVGTMLASVDDTTVVDTDSVNLAADPDAQDIVARRAVSVSSNMITLSQGLELGLEDISVTVKTITDPGKLTLTANADTGIGGTSQTIDVGTIAAGSAKTFDFDRLGVSFTLNNANATAVNAESFEAYTPKANTLVVESAMDGEALFQVGAGTRDNVVIDGFKDIRITGYNNNANTSEKLVFDNINTTLNTIAQNTTESLSEANFATLENQIEAAITTISDFRSYLGAQQNRIEFAISNIQAQSENLTAANSRIVDTDYAAETANLTKTQIMQQAATAMLAQANQMPNVILALLK